jgi:hypothetical protein
MLRATRSRQQRRSVDDVVSAIRGEAIVVVIVW